MLFGYKIEYTRDLADNRIEFIPLDDEAKAHLAASDPLPPLFSKKYHLEAVDETIANLGFPDNAVFIRTEKPLSEHKLRIIEHILANKHAASPDGKQEDQPTYITFDHNGALTYIAEISGRTLNILLLDTLHIRTEAGQTIFSDLRLEDSEDDIEIEQYRIDRTTGPEELRRIFWEQINPDLSDPFLNPDESFYDSVDFQEPDSGLENITRKLVNCWIITNNIKDAPTSIAYLSIDEDCDGDSLCESTITELQDHSHLLEVLRDTFNVYPAYGATLEYNDGADHRISGYSRHSRAVIIELDTPESAHDRLAYLAENLTDVTDHLRTIKADDDVIQRIIGAQDQAADS